MPAVHAHRERPCERVARSDAAGFNRRVGGQKHGGGLQMGGFERKVALVGESSTSLARRARARRARTPHSSSRVRCGSCPRNNSCSASDNFERPRRIRDSRCPSAIPSWRPPRGGTSVEVGEFVACAGRRKGDAPPLARLGGDERGGGFCDIGWRADRARWSRPSRARAASSRRTRSTALRWAITRATNAGALVSSNVRGGSTRGRRLPGNVLCGRPIARHRWRASSGAAILSVEVAEGGLVARATGRPWWRPTL